MGEMMTALDESIAIRRYSIDVPFKLAISH